MSSHLYNFEGANPDAMNYGRRFWGVYLADGRQVMIHADKIVVSDSGDLVAIRSHELDNETLEYKPASESISTFGLAKGQWLSYYAASVMNGDPVAVDNSEKWVEPAS